MTIVKMMKGLFISLSLVGSLSANAGLITFNFNDDVSDQHSLSYVSDGYTLTIEAFFSDDTDANIHGAAAGGLGVDGNSNARLNSGEYLTFSLDGASFDAASIFFTNVNDNELVNVDADDGFSTSFSAPTAELNLSALDASSLVVSATGGEGRREGVRVNELQLNVIDVEPEPSTDVPEPSTLALFSLAVFGLMVRRIKK